MGKEVRTTPQADLHILELDAWWRDHRDRAQDLFEQELTIAFRTIAEVPSAGKLHGYPGLEVRRLLMRATRNHVYYVENEDYVLVVAIWGAVKGSGPDLRMLGGSK